MSSSEMFVDDDYSGDDDEIDPPYDMAFTVMYIMLSYFGDEPDENIIKTNIPSVLTAFDGERKNGKDPIILVKPRVLLFPGAIATHESIPRLRYLAAANEAKKYIESCIAGDRLIWGKMLKNQRWLKRYNNDPAMKRLYIDDYHDSMVKP